jgi:DNA-binding NtrC family response regulator
VRELRNVVEQAAVLATGEGIEEEDLGLARTAGFGGAESVVAAPGASFSDAKRRATEEFERDYLLRALRAHGGNISRTAESIGMVRQSLQQKIRELGLRDEDWREPPGAREKGGR